MSTRSPQGHARRNALILLGVVAVIVLAALGAFLFVDGPPPEDADLALEEARVPDAQNGYVLFEAGTEETYWPIYDDLEEDGEAPSLDPDKENGMEEGAAQPPDPPQDAAGGAIAGEDAGLGEEQSEYDAPTKDLLRGRRYDPSLAAKILDRNKELLDRFDETLALPAFQFPTWGAKDDPFQKIVRWRHVPDIAFVRAWERAEARDYAAASASALAAVRFVARYETAARTSLHYLIGSFLRRTAYGRLEALLPRVELERTEWLAWLREFGTLAPSRASPSLAIRGEYGCQRTSIRNLKSGEGSIDDGFIPQMDPRGLWRSRIFLLPNETFELSAQVARIALSAVPATGRWKAPDWSALEEAATMNPWLPGRNGVGRGGIPSIISDHEGLIRTHQVAWYRHHLLHAALALHAFEAIEGRPATTLEELRSEWLPESPEDPATGTPLHYDPARRLLWYAGTDGVDMVDGDDPSPADDFDDPEAYLAQPCYRAFQR